MILRKANNPKSRVVVFWKLQLSFETKKKLINSALLTELKNNKYHIVATSLFETYFYKKISNVIR